MQEQTMAKYCFIDDFFKTIGRKQEHPSKLSDAELLTTALSRARYFDCNLHTACQYMQEQQQVKTIEKSGFIRRLHKLQDQLTALFLALGNTL